MTNRANESSQYIAKKITEILANGDEKSIEEVIRLLLTSDKVFIYGAGRSGLIGKAFAIRLVQLGLKVFFIGETTTPIVDDTDVALIISNTGETMSAIQTANIIRRVGAKVVVITSKKLSKLAHAGNVVVTLDPEPDDGTAALAPLGTLFEDSTLIFLDGIIAQIMEKRKETESKMRGRHAIWV
ncbi:MAG: SIS domain-containing protein [Thermoplasmata archaeon]|nr:SIS domain-containing protein [Candidatus Thermoplasmatota archaeon]MCJ2669541.1 SIS domain-containing protein [Candidatus Thermoplasmatota archaeon]MCK4949065.1 SIS domain-containing protein [Thermoplasmata archaeon]